MYSIIGAITPFPYSIMISEISDLVIHEHLGANEMTGIDVVKKYALYLAEGIISIPNLSLEILGKVKSAIEICLTVDNVTGETSCSNKCYNIDIVTINKGEAYDCHQIEYHYSDGVSTMGRGSEYNVNGINSVEPGAHYYDYVNNREYDVYVQ